MTGSYTTTGAAKATVFFAVLVFGGFGLMSLLIKAYFLAVPFAFLVAFSLAGIPQALMRVRTDERGFWIDAPGRHSYTSWNELEELRTSGFKDSIIRVRWRSGEAVIDLKSFNEPDQLARTFLVHPPVAPYRQVFDMAKSNLPFLLLPLAIVLPMVIAITWLSIHDSRFDRNGGPMMTGLSLFLLLLVLFAVAINLYRIEVDGEGIRKSMYWNAGRFIAWSDISAVRLTAGSGRNGPYETLRISSPAATITTGTRLDGFGNLKEYVLSHISPELVQGAASLPTSARPPEHRAERNEVHDSHVRE